MITQDLMNAMRGFGVRQHARHVPFLIHPTYSVPIVYDSNAAAGLSRLAALQRSTQTDDD